MRDLFRFLFRSRNAILFLVLLAVSISLLVDHNAHHRAQALTATNNAVGTLYSWRADITEYTSLKERNRALAKENAAWRSRSREAYAPIGARFVRIQDTIREQQYDALPARIVFSTTHKQKNYLILDKGLREGVDTDRGVIGTDGIVGVVGEVGPRFCAVKSVLSPDLKVSVRSERTGHFGLLVWDTSDPRTASVVDIAKHAKLRTGDLIVTRGGDGIFPVGIPVGEVIDVRDTPGDGSLGITIRLAEDLARDGHVYILKDLLRLERDSLARKLDTE